MRSIHEQSYKRYGEGYKDVKVYYGHLIITGRVVV